MSDCFFHIRSLHDDSVTAVDARSGRSFARHAHDEFGIGLVTSGAQRSWSGRGLVEAISGNLITVNPAEIHDGTPIGSERSWSMLYFSQKIVASIAQDLSEGRVSALELYAPVVDDPRLAGLFLAVRGAALDGERETEFEELLLVLFGRLFGATAREKPKPSHRIARVRERIDDDPASPHQLSELASQAGLSRFQTVRAFARMTGLTPHAYVMQRRLDSARRLIRSGNSLANAAAEAGFADQSHMHRIFTARHGFTPGTYAAAFRSQSAISFKSLPSVSR